MNLVKLLFFIIPLATYSQKLQVIYEFSYIKDTINKNNRSLELMALEIQNTKSVFYSYNQFKNDSIYAITKDFSKYEGGHIKHQIKKDLYNKEMVVVDRIGTVDYVFKDHELQNWKIEQQYKKILDYNVQLATTTYRGRNWIAWFTTEIPINDGPFKFFNLPGLILELEDDNNFFNYKVSAIHKNFVSRSNIPSATLIEKQILTTRKQYLKEIERNKLDPAKDFKKAIYNNEIFLNGKDPQQMIKEYEDKMKEKQKHDNNPIEKE
ncbi:GLPGLI family protein [Chryseobacterium taklimakanense]|uniref:GLPGLI family protein n=1 Tax=Chryseobacterium taklimakanense TaxID=536441 RepID=UPI000F5F9AC9|nr:GLPGLI family protein [Chryseobacterium taklimakanense]AZI23463.1 GLPGLI family protein [Chryseobacterium taklimakanense]